MESETRLIFSQIISAVKECHSRDIIHRDIRPENVLFKDLAQSNIRLRDFALSSTLDMSKGINGAPF